MRKLFILLFFACLSIKVADAQTQAPNVNTFPTTPHSWPANQFQPFCPLAFANPLVGSATACAANPQSSPQVFDVTLTGNTTWARPTGLTSGESVIFRFAQDATGGRTVTLPTDGSIIVPSTLICTGSGTPSGSCLANNTLALTGTALSVDYVGCVGHGGSAPSWTATSMECLGLSPNLSAPAVATFVQGPLGTYTSSPGTSISLSGSAVGSGNMSLGAVFYSAPTDYLTGCTIGGNPLTLLDHVTDSVGHWFTDFILYNITGGPTAVMCNFSTGPTAAQIMWLEYAGLGAGSVGGHAPQYQPQPGTTANAISSGSATGSVLAVGLSASFGSGSTTGVVPGTGFTSRIHDTVNLLNAEDKVLSSSGSVTATFTDTTSGSTNYYMTSIVTLHP